MPHVGDGGEQTKWDTERRRKNLLVDFTTDDGRTISRFSPTPSARKPEQRQQRQETSKGIFNIMIKTWFTLTKYLVLTANLSEARVRNLFVSPDELLQATTTGELAGRPNASLD